MAATTAKSKQQRQCVWLVRYGLTEHALVEDVGPYDSDIDPAVGILHAKSIAERIAKGHGSNSDDTIPKFVYADPFMRTTHTGKIIADELLKKTTSNKQLQLLRSEEGLYEWLIPSLLVEKSTGKRTLLTKLQLMATALLTTHIPPKRTPTLPRAA